jgi:hypothetical protein
VRFKSLGIREHGAHLQVALDMSNREAFDVHELENQLRRRSCGKCEGTGHIIVTVASRLTFTQFTVALPCQ